MSESEEFYKVLPVEGIGTGVGMYAVFDMQTERQVAGPYYWRDVAERQAEKLNNALRMEGYYED